MRERRPGDWVTDLTGRHGLEQQVADELRTHRNIELLEINTTSFDRLDFTIGTKAVFPVEVELKAKWQPYQRWWHQHRLDVDESDLFILDELALRRVVAGGPTSQLLIHDHPSGRWVLFSVADLLLAPKARVSRPLRGRRETTKGKILISLGDGQAAGTTIGEAVSYLAPAILDTHRRWSQVEPWPSHEQELQVNDALHPRRGPNGVRPVGSPDP